MIILSGIDCSDPVTRSEYIINTIAIVHTLVSSFYLLVLGIPNYCNRDLTFSVRAFNAIGILIKQSASSNPGNNSLN